MKKISNVHRIPIVTILGIACVINTVQAKDACTDTTETTEVNPALAVRPPIIFDIADSALHWAKDRSAASVTKFGKIDDHVTDLYATYSNDKQTRRRSNDIFNGTFQEMLREIGYSFPEGTPVDEDNAIHMAAGATSSLGKGSNEIGLAIVDPRNHRDDSNILVDEAKNHFHINVTYQGKVPDGPGYLTGSKPRNDWQRNRDMRLAFLDSYIQTTLANNNPWSYFVVRNAAHKNLLNEQKHATTRVPVDSTLELQIKRDEANPLYKPAEILHNAQLIAMKDTRLQPSWHALSAVISDPHRTPAQLESALGNLYDSMNSMRIANLPLTEDYKSTFIAGGKIWIDTLGKPAVPSTSQLELPLGQFFRSVEPSATITANDTTVTFTKAERTVNGKEVHAIDIGNIVSTRKGVDRFQFILEATKIARDNLLDGLYIYDVTDERDAEYLRGIGFVRDESGAPRSYYRPAK